MRNLLATLAVLVIVFSILGWARSWYTVGSQPADLGKFAFRIEIDAPKVGTDFKDGFAYIKEKLSKKEEAEAEAK